MCPWPSWPSLERNRISGDEYFLEKKNCDDLDKVGRECGGRDRDRETEREIGKVLDHLNIVFDVTPFVVLGVPFDGI